MSLEAINEIRGVESAADQTRAEARAGAQKLIADAEREGKELLSKWQEKSAADAAEAMKKAEAAAELRRAEIMAQAQTEADALKAQAQANMARAVKAITERVVES